MTIIFIIIILLIIWYTRRAQKPGCIKKAACTCKVNKAIESEGKISNNGVFDRFGNSASAITDTTQNWLNVTTTPLNSSYTEFYASRFVNSSDTSGRDTSIPCNTTTSYFWQLLPSNTNGTWDLIMDENCHPLITEPVAEHATKLILGATALITLSLL